MATVVNDLFVTFQEAEALLASGELKQAADICRDLIDKHPEFPYGYHLMSSLFRATGTYGNALTFSQMAINIEPNIPVFHIQQGQILFSIDENESAAEAFKLAGNLDPMNPVPLLLWADTQAQMGKFDEAVKLFARARVLSDVPEIDLHEGVCLMMKGELTKAGVLFDRVIERVPDYEWGYVQKAKLLMEQGHYTKAEATFLRGLKCNPQSYEALQGMALVSELQGQMDTATRFAMDAVQANPKGIEAHIHLGSLMITQEQYPMAEQVLMQARSVQPDNVYITQMLVTVMCRLHKHQIAAQLLDELLDKDPDNRVMKYFRAMLNGERFDTPPQEYIRNLFDQYADRFDHHVQYALGYDVPALLFDTVSQFTTSKTLSLLDLGCGTGLVAQAFKGTLSQAVGVDLSVNMITKARSKHCYNALYAQDLSDFMQSCEETFDVVAAADVLIYQGNLLSVMGMVRTVLNTDGLFIFTIEKEVQIDDFSLKTTGRYTHSPAYIKKIASEQGYQLVKEEDIVVRTENQIPVAGCLFVLKKQVMH